MDHETGFTFTEFPGQYTVSGKPILFRVAVPTGVATGSDFDVVLQIVAPIDVGWTAVSWGAQMVRSPLTAAWASGRGSAIVSSRYARSHVLPDVYSGASYQVFAAGTHANRTHWQVTAKCTGCTAFSGSGGATRRLNAKGSNRLAFAYCKTPPYQPSSSSSGFEVHDVVGYWNHDFTTAQNTAFASLVAKNTGSR